MADEKHAPVESVKPAVGDPMSDRASFQPGANELRSGDDAVLTRRQRGDRPIGTAFYTHNAAHETPLAKCGALWMACIQSAAHPILEGTCAALCRRLGVRPLPCPFPALRATRRTCVVWNLGLPSPYPARTCCALGAPSTPPYFLHFCDTGTLTCSPVRK